MVPIHIRTMNESDLNFVLDSWLESVATDKAPLTPARLVFAHHRPISERLIYVSQVLIATSEEDANQILGWACGDTDAIHYIYVKQPFRRLGIATRLAKSLPVITTCSHWTHKLVRWGVANRHALIYNPYLLMERLQ